MHVVNSAVGLFLSPDTPNGPGDASRLASPAPATDETGAAGGRVARPRGTPPHATQPNAPEVAAHMWISEEGRTAVAHADAHLTFSNRRELARLAADAVERGARTVVVDLSETEYVDAAALATLGALAHRLGLRGAAVRLANVRPAVAAALAAARLDRFAPAGAPAPRRAD